MENVFLNPLIFFPTEIAMQLDWLAEQGERIRTTTIAMLWQAINNHFDPKVTHRVWKCWEVIHNYHTVYAYQCKTALNRNVNSALKNCYTALDCRDDIHFRKPLQKRASLAD